MLESIPAWLKTVPEGHPAALFYKSQVKVKRQGPVEPVLISISLLRRIVYTKCMSLCFTKEAGTKEIPTSSYHEQRNDVSSKSESHESTEGKWQHREERDKGKLLTDWNSVILKTCSNIYFISLLWKTKPVYNYFKQAILTSGTKMSQSCGKNTILADKSQSIVCLCNQSWLLPRDWLVTL